MEVQVAAEVSAKGRNAEQFGVLFGSLASYCRLNRRWLESQHLFPLFPSSFRSATICCILSCSLTNTRPSPPSCLFLS